MVWQWMTDHGLKGWPGEAVPCRGSRSLIKTDCSHSQVDWGTETAQKEWPVDKLQEPQHTHIDPLPPAAHPPSPATFQSFHKLDKQCHSLEARGSNTWAHGRNITISLHKVGWQSHHSVTETVTALECQSPFWEENKRKNGACTRKRQDGNGKRSDIPIEMATSIWLWVQNHFSSWSTVLPEL